MGYNENQYSLPRWEDLLVSRQGMYDDLYHYIPSMGWMFLRTTQITPVPLIFLFFFSPQRSLTTMEVARQLLLNP